MEREESIIGVLWWRRNRHWRLHFTFFKEPDDGCCFEISPSTGSLLEFVWFVIDVISILSWILVIVSELLFPRLIDSDTGVVCRFPSSSWDGGCCWSMDEVVVCCKGVDCWGGDDDDAVEFIIELFVRLYFEAAINWYLLSAIAAAFDGPFLSVVFLSMCGGEFNV